MRHHTIHSEVLVICHYRFAWSLHKSWNIYLYRFWFCNLQILQKGG